MDMRRWLDRWKDTLIASGESRSSAGMINRLPEFGGKIVLFLMARRRAWILIEILANSVRFQRSLR